MSLIAPQQVNDDQIDRFGKLIYDRTGIRISPQKKSLLSNRLRRRLRALDINGYDEYFGLLQKLAADDGEWDAFLQEITTHETYLFRDKAQWDWLMESFVPEIQQAARQGHRDRRLRIWSAACSTGDEAYTAACCLAATLNHPGQWTIEIVGTDIGVDAVAQSRKAVFGQRAMRKVPESFRRRFFTQVDSSTWAAKPALSRWTSFRQHNLLDAFRGAPFDLVLVKNVLIYFDHASKQTVMGHVDRALRPGGFLITGPAEGVSDLLKTYQRQLPWLHRKPDAVRPS